ncbi:MAG: helix-turn-helix domain-containing protein [Bacteroidetes bacterium]|nr:helix-turn-helix domain-containing protein [Bacteroidota bacterium]MBU1115853.1 helix-turn-helix domain-containing protein [Bacteroidota bacterium]MBU1797967.1 helix-turn-helix domain-containing protein [Bacteroidota bacterium]
MNQHEIGKKVAELRTAKGLTQEELALRCGIKERIVQKIESGAISPRILVLKKIGLELDYQFTFDENDDLKFWLLTLHLSNFLVIPIFPLIIWLMKKDESPEIDGHGKDVLNFQITMMIYLFVSLFLVLFIVGIVLLLALSLYITIITIINSINVVMERDYKYYFTIRFVK